MRNVLITGAVLCAIIGVFFVCSFAFEAVKLWPNVPHDPSSLLLASFNFWAMPAYVLLAFAPGIVLIRIRRNETQLWRVAIVGAAELITFVAFLALLLTKLFPSL
jgi:hypothetical protein